MGGARKPSSFPESHDIYMIYIYVDIYIKYEICFCPIIRYMFLKNHCLLIIDLNTDTYFPIYFRRQHHIKAESVARQS